MKVLSCFVTLQYELMGNFHCICIKSLTQQWEALFVHTFNKISGNRMTMNSESWLQVHAQYMATVIRRSIACCLCLALSAMSVKYMQLVSNLIRFSVVFLIIIAKQIVQCRAPGIQSAPIRTFSFAGNLRCSLKLTFHDKLMWILFNNRGFTVYSIPIAISRLINWADFSLLDRDIAHKCISCQDSSHVSLLNHFTDRKILYLLKNIVPKVSLTNAKRWARGAFNKWSCFVKRDMNPNLALTQIWPWTMTLTWTISNCPAPCKKLYTKYKVSIYNTSKVMISVKVVLWQTDSAKTICPASIDAGGITIYGINGQQPWIWMKHKATWCLVRITCLPYVTTCSFLSRSDVVG